MSLQERMKSMALKRVRQEAAVAAAEHCGRRSKRKMTSLPGTITFPNLRVQVQCTILDMSGSGAQLELTEASQKQFGDIDHLPSRIVLIMRADRMQVDSEMVWRSGIRVGVRFLGPPRPWTYGLR